MVFLLINTSNFIVKNQISDEAAILACFEYFLGYPRPRLTKAREAKIAKSDLATSSIGVTLARSASVKGVSMGIASAGGACVDTRLSDIGSWLSIK